MEKSKAPDVGKLDIRTRDDSRLPGPERLLRRLVRDGLDVPTAARLVAVLDEKRG
jgi:hypothetical protein